jgi:hypothetical protein
MTVSLTNPGSQFAEAKGNATLSRAGCQDRDAGQDIMFSTENCCVTTLCDYRWALGFRKLLT